MTANPKIETLSLSGFVLALLIGALSQTSAGDTIAAMIFLAAGGLFTSELWWKSRYLPRFSR